MPSCRAGPGRTSAIGSRLPAAVVVIYAIEWNWSALYAALGLHPWHYEHGWASDFSGGHITLLYLPAWLVFGLRVVPVWEAIRSGVATSSRPASSAG